MSDSATNENLREGRGVRGDFGKDQGVGMKKGWETKTLGDVCTTIQDGAHESPQMQFDSPGKGRFLYITSKNIRTNYLELKNVSYVERDFHDRIYPRCSPRVGDVLLTKDGANTGNVALNTIDEPFSLLSSVCLIKTNPTALNSGFLCYYLQSPDGLKSIIGQMTGAAIKRIILRDVKLATIPLPPLAEQQRIVGLLDEAFEGLATAKSNAEKNLQNARALFESHLQSVFTQRGPGWVEKTFDDVCHKITDGTHHSPQTQFSERASGTFPYITSKNIRNNYMDLSKMAYIEQAFHDEVYARCKPSLGDVLLTKDGANTGNVTLNTIDEPFSLLSSVCLIKTNQSVLKPAFLCFYLQSSTGLSAILGQMTGAAIKRIVLKDIKKAVIPFPPLKEQETILTTLNSLLTETHHLARLYEQKLVALEALKKSLLHQAFTGEL